MANAIRLNVIAKMAIINQMSEKAQWQAYERLARGLIASCNTQGNVKVKEQLVKEYYHDEKLFDLLELLLMRPGATKNIAQQQNIANFINCMINQRILEDPKPMHFHKVFSFFTHTLLNWTLPYSPKKLIFSSFKESLDFWQEELDEFWETVAETSIDLLELALTNPQCPQQHFSKKINSACLSDGFTLVLELPVNVDEVCLTIIFFLSAFSEQFRMRSSAYQQRVVDMLKKLHRQVFSERFILDHREVIKQLLNFEHDLVLDIMDDKETRPAAMSMCNWDQYSQDLHTIINLKAAPFQGQPGTYNIFLLTEHWESPKLLEQKTTALSIINDLIALSETISEVEEGSNSAISLDYISGSVISSLMWLAAQERNPYETETFLEMALLGNLYNYLNIFNMSLMHYTQLITKLIFPIINHEIEQCNTTFEGNCEDHNHLLTECIDNKKETHRLSVACRLLDYLIQVESQLIDYIKRYVLSILTDRLTSDVLPLNAERAQHLPGLSVEACFLILSVMTGRDLFTAEEKMLQSLLTEEVFLSLGGNEKKYLYFYLCFAWERVRDERNPCDFFLTYVFKESDPDVQYFILDFIFNISEDYYCDDFTRMLFQRFNELQSEQQVFDILNLIVVRHMHRINEHTVCNLVNKCVAQAKKKANKILPKLADPQDDDEETPRIFEVGHYINYCRHVAKSHDYVRGKPDLIASLFAAFKTTKAMAKVMLDDQTVFIGSELLACLKCFPEGFIAEIPTVVDCFRSSEYHGCVYYQFFGNCMETISSYSFDSGMNELVDLIYNTIAEAYAYFIHFPDAIVPEQCIYLGNIQVMLINLFILFGDKLAQEHIQETVRLCYELQRAETYKEERVLLVRGNTLILLCQILSSKQYPLQEIYFLAKSKHYFGRCDSILLIYLLNQIRPELPPEDHITLVAIILEMIRSVDSFKKSRDVKYKEQIQKYNSIFCYVTYPIDLSMTEINQANQFFQDYGKEDGVTRNLVFQEINNGMADRQLLKYLQKTLKTQPDDELVNLGLFDPDQQEGEQSGEEKPQPPRKRKIVKVIGDRDINGNTQVTYVPSTTPTPSIGKRDMANAVRIHDESRLLDRGFDKRRKMNELLSHSAEKTTKRAIMMQKINKKVTRI